MHTHTDQTDTNSSESSRISLESILEAIGNLQPQGKSKLVNEIVGKEPGVAIVLGSNNLTGSVVFQINMMSSEQAVQIIKAVSDRIETEGK